MTCLDNRITLAFTNPIFKELLLSGFEELNEHNGFVQGDYRSYKYIYKESSDCMTFTMTSHENDIYIETEEIILPEPILEEIRNEKITYFSKLCSKNIISGVDVDINGTIEHFSYTDSDQTNIKELFDTVLSTGMPMYYHADGLGCRLYSVNQIISIYTAQITNKTHHLTYFNQLKLYVNNLTDIEAVKKIEYGTTKLTDKYLETYNAAMIQAEENMRYLLSKVTV